jgi:thiamine-monophosphate kinase
MHGNKYPSSEYAVIAKIQSILGTQPSGFYTTGIGDDAAVRTDTSGSTLIITTDLSVENVHFSLEYMTMQEVGYRAMASNVSDCAAMGALPDSAFIQLVVPEVELSSSQKESSFLQKIEDLYRGFEEACSTWHFSIAGGDLSRGRQWVIGITLIGRKKKDRRILLRTGMQPDDKVYVSGVPGRSAAGLFLLQKNGRHDIPERYVSFVNAHLRPVPRIALGMHLATDPQVHAVMDLSDGLSKDCRTLCYENGCGINLYESTSLLPREMLQLSRESGTSWHSWFFHGGEDYELLFTASANFEPLRCPDCIPICIGECSGTGTELMITNDGISSPLAAEGFDHFDTLLK